MSLRVSINYYSVDELKEIVDRMATNMNLLLSPQAARSIATVSAGQPRRVKHHLQNLQNHFPNAESQQISVQQVKEFLAAFDIDDKGLVRQERQCLEYLKDVGAASLESLAISLGIDCDYVRRQIEPLLLRERLVTIGPGGRRLTPARAGMACSTQHCRGLNTWTQSKPAPPRSNWPSCATRQTGR